jgi:hypothetical protein
LGVEAAAGVAIFQKLQIKANEDDNECITNNDIKHTTDHSQLHTIQSVAHLTDPETIILFMGADSSIKVNPTKALSREPKYASRTSGDTGGGRGKEGRKR